MDSFTRFTAAALKADTATIVLATKSHQESIRRRLEADGVDIDGAVQQGTFIPLNLADLLPTHLGGWSV